MVFTSKIYCGKPWHNEYPGKFLTGFDRSLSGEYLPWVEQFETDYKMEVVPTPPLPAGFSFTAAGPIREAQAISDLMGACYENIHPSPATEQGSRQHPVFAANLWVWIIDEARGLGHRRVRCNDYRRFAGVDSDTARISRLVIRAANCVRVALPPLRFRGRRQLVGAAALTHLSSPLPPFISVHSWFVRA